MQNVDKDANCCFLPIGWWRNERCHKYDKVTNQQLVRATDAFNQCLHNHFPFSFNPYYKMSTGIL